MQLPSLARLDLRREAAAPTSTGVADSGTDEVSVQIAKITNVLAKLQFEKDANERERAQRVMHALIDAAMPTIIGGADSGTDKGKALIAKVLSETDANERVEALSALYVLMVSEFRDDLDKWARRPLQVAMREAGGLPILVQLILTGTDEEKLAAAAVLYPFIFSDRGDFRESGAIDAIVQLLRNGTTAQKTQALLAAKELTEVQYRSVTDKRAFWEAGGLQALLALVRSGDADQKVLSTMTLGNMAWGSMNGRAYCTVIRNAGGFPALLELLQNGTEAQQAKAARTLMILESGEKTGALRDAGGIQALVDRLRTDNGVVDGLFDLATENTDWARQNAHAMVEAGCLPMVLSLMSDFTYSYNASGRVSILLGFLAMFEETAMKAFMELLVTDDTVAAEAGFSTLQFLVFRSRPWKTEDTVQALLKAGVVPTLVSMLNGLGARDPMTYLVAILNVGGDASVQALYETGGLGLFYSRLRRYNSPAVTPEVTRKWMAFLYNHSLKFRLLIDAYGSIDEPPEGSTFRFSDREYCLYWIDVLPKVDEVRNAIQAHGEIYDHLVRIAPYLKKHCEDTYSDNDRLVVTSPRTLDRMLHSFRLLGAAATAESNPSIDAATTLLRALMIEVDEAMRSGVWVNAQELLGKTKALIKAGTILVAAGAVAVTPLLATKLAWDLGILKMVVGTCIQTMSVDDVVGGTLYVQKKLLRTLKRQWHEEMDTPEFRAMEEGPVEAYTRGDLEADMRALGLNEEQLMQAQRFEHWMAIAGTIAERFGAAAEGGDPAAQHVLEMVEALQERLLAPPGEGRNPSILYEISAREFAANKRTLNEMLAAEQAIENEEAAPAEQQSKRRRTAAPIAASLAAFFGPETVVRLRLRAEDLHPLLAARHGDA